MFPFAGSPSSSEPSSSKSKVSLAVVLQVNATIIVGLLLLLTLSDTFLIPNIPEYKVVELPIIEQIIIDGLRSSPETVNFNNITMDYLDLLTKQHVDRVNHEFEVQRLIDEGQRDIANLTIRVILPFVLSSAIILGDYLAEPIWKEGRVKRWLMQRFPIILTALGMFGIIYFFVSLQDILIFNVDIKEIFLDYYNITLR